MLVFGHRGSRHPGPENTAQAVLAALAANADGVEIDLRRTDAGQVVIRHDPLASPYDSPGLSELLDAAAGRGQVICEIKNEPGEPDFDAPRCATAELTLAILRARSGDQVTISSFDWHTIEWVRSRAPEIPTAFLTPPGVGPGAALAYAVAAGHPQIHPYLSEVLADPDVVGRAHAAGVRVIVWTVTDLAEALALRAAGVDGVICDDPAAIVAGLAGVAGLAAESA